MTEPVETYDDGGALYEAGPFLVDAQPASEVNPGVVNIDGRTVTPHTARLLARVLEAAADRATAEPGREARSAVDRLMEAVTDPDRRPTEAEHEAAQAEIHPVERAADPCPYCGPDRCPMCGSHRRRAMSAERPAGLDPTYRAQES